MKSLKQVDSSTNNPFQALLYVGNSHETVPLRLLTDPYLTPRAKIAWQLIKQSAKQFNGTVFPSYNELSLWLSDKGFQQKAISRTTVSQTLLLLRLTRWLTLCETVRNKQGQILGNVYIMNDEPLSISDCLIIDGDYLRLLEKTSKHNDPLVKDVANAIINEMLEQKNLSYLVSHIPLIRERYQQHKLALLSSSQTETLPENIKNAVEITQGYLLHDDQDSLSPNFGHGEKMNNSLSPNFGHGEKMNNSLSPNFELSTSNNDKSLILKKFTKTSSQYSTSTNINNKYSTVLQDQISSELKSLKLTSAEEKQLTLAMSSLDRQTIQAIMLEAKTRIASGTVRKPVGYLMNLINKAKNGEFKPYFLSKAQEFTNSKKQLSDSEVSEPEITLSKQEQLAQIKKLTQLLRVQH